MKFFVKMTNYKQYQSWVAWFQFLSNSRCTKMNSRQCRFITHATLGETRSDRDVSFLKVCFELSQGKTFPWMWTNRLDSIVFPNLLQMRCRTILWTKEPAICRTLYAWTKYGRDHLVRQATYKETFVRRFEISNRKVEPPRRWKDHIVHHKTQRFAQHSSHPSVCVNKYLSQRR